MQTPFRLMCVLAHPDDESIALGGTLAKYAAEGIEISLVMATRGERGWFGEPEQHPGESALGRIREEELRAACRVLGIARLDFLDYIDGDLDLAQHQRILPQLVDLVRTVRPHVVVTFGPDGFYGHPDHIAISQFTTASLLYAADASYSGTHGLPSHRVSKLYYRVSTSEWYARFMPIFGDLVMMIDGQERRPSPCVPWLITTHIDACAHWQRTWQAVLCHQTQLQHKELLTGLREDDHHCFWGRQEFYRAFSLVNSGRQVEQDLFAGLVGDEQSFTFSSMDEAQPQTVWQPELVLTPLRQFE